MSGTCTPNLYPILHSTVTVKCRKRDKSAVPLLEFVSKCNVE